MPVNGFEKLAVIAASEGAQELLERLLKQKGVALAEPGEREALVTCEPPEATVEKAEALYARLARVLPVLNRHSGRRRTLFAPRVECPSEDFYSDGRYDVAMRVVEQTEKILAREVELREAVAAARAEMNIYSPYLDWERRLDFAGTAGTRALLGRLPAAINTQMLLQALEGRAAIVQLVCEDRSGKYIFVLAHHSEAAQTQRALEGIGFESAAFPARDGTAKELFDRADKARVDAVQAQAGLGKRLFSLAIRLDVTEQLGALAEEELSRERRLQALQGKECVCFVLRCAEDQRERVLRLLERAGAYVRGEAATV